MKRSIRMNEKDDVSTVLENIYIEDSVGIYNEQNEFLFEIKAKEDITFGNKIALFNKKIGDKVIKYGENIGEVTKDFKVGELVHVHNVKSLSVDIPPAIKDEIIRQMKIKGE